MLGTVMAVGTLAGALLAARRAKQDEAGWRPKDRQRPVSAALQVYAALALSADKGAARLDPDRLTVLPGVKDEEPAAPQVPDTAAGVVRRIGGKWEKGKRHNGEFYDFTRSYGGGVYASVVVDRPAVCERVVTAVREVTREVPDPEALAALPTTTVTETVEDVEWRCLPLLADDEAVSA